MAIGGDLLVIGVLPDNFKDALYSNIVKQKIKDFKNLAQSSSVDHMVSKLNDTGIIVTPADISLQKKSKTKSKR